MPFPTAVPAPDIVYPIDVSWPTYPKSTGSVAGLAGSLPNVNSVSWGNIIPVRGGNQNPEETGYGSFAAVGSQERYFIGGGMAGAALFRAGAGGIGKVFGHPALAGCPVEETQLAPGYVNPEWGRVQIWDWWVNWSLGAGAGVFTGNTTGIQLHAWRGATQGIADFLTVQGGGANPKVMCGIYGRNDGGVQQIQYRSFSPAEVLLESVPLTISSPAQWNNFRFVLVSAANGRPGTLAVHINDELTPAIERTFGSAVLAVPTDYTTTSVCYGTCMAAVDASGAGITREQIIRYRLRGGRHLPDGTEISS